MRRLVLGLAVAVGGLLGVGLLAPKAPAVAKAKPGPTVTITSTWIVAPGTYLLRGTFSDFTNATPAITVYANVDSGGYGSGQSACQVSTGASGNWMALVTTSAEFPETSCAFHVSAYDGESTDDDYDTFTGGTSPWGLYRDIDGDETYGFPVWNADPDYYMLNFLFSFNGSTYVVASYKVPTGTTPTDAAIAAFGVVEDEDGSSVVAVELEEPTGVVFNADTEIITIVTETPSTSDQWIQFAYEVDSEWTYTDFFMAPEGGGWANADPDSEVKIKEVTWLAPDTCITRWVYKFTSGNAASGRQSKVNLRQGLFGSRTSAWKTRTVALVSGTKYNESLIFADAFIDSAYPQVVRVTVKPIPATMFDPFPESESPPFQTTNDFMDGGGFDSTNGFWYYADSLTTSSLYFDGDNLRGRVRFPAGLFTTPATVSAWTFEYKRSTDTSWTDITGTVGLTNLTGSNVEKVMQVRHPDNIHNCDFRFSYTDGGGTHYSAVVQILYTHPNERGEFK